MAKTSYVIKRLREYGEVHQEGNFLYWCQFNGEVVDFCDQGGEATCIRVRRAGEEDDPQTDYFAGVFVDNVSQAIRLAIRPRTLIHREPCPACGCTSGRCTWEGGRSVWTCPQCGGPVSGREQKPKPPSAEEVGVKENQPGLPPIGTKVYYRGDAANPSDMGRVVTHNRRPPTANVLLEDGRSRLRLPAPLFGRPDQGGGIRFEILEEPQEPERPERPRPRAVERPPAPDCPTVVVEVRGGVAELAKVRGGPVRVVIFDHDDAAETPGQYQPAVYEPAPAH